MNLKSLAGVFAVVFILLGILGFIPSITSDSGRLLGLFEVDTLHNIIHLASGLFAAWGAATSESAARMYFKVFGVVYAIIAVVGLIQGDTVLGLIGVNWADHILDIVITLIALVAGFGMKGGKSMDAPAA